MICVGLELQYWDVVKDDIEKALKLDNQRCTVDDIYENLLNKTMQLWAVHDGDLKVVMTTEIVNYAQIKAVNFVTATGEMNEQTLASAVNTICAWAQEQGCCMAEFTGRLGWQKVMTKLGFSTPRIQMTKIL